jgi:hypothetical protein
MQVVEEVDEGTHVERVEGVLEAEPLGFASEREHRGLLCVETVHRGRPHQRLQHSHHLFHNLTLLLHLFGVV